MVEPKKDNSPNTMFYLTCLGNKTPRSPKLLYRKEGVNKPIEEVCPHRHIEVAFNQYSDNIEMTGMLENGSFTEFVKYPVWNEGVGPAHEWEKLEYLISNYHLSSNWYDNNDSWGWYNEETMSWTGAVEMVRNFGSAFIIYLSFRLGVIKLILGLHCLDAVIRDLLLSPVHIR